MSMSFTEVLVPLDGSPFAERAIGLALEIADRTGASVTLMSSTADDPEARATYLAGLVPDDRRRPHVSTVVCDDESAARAIILLGRPETLVCMSSHGHGRSEALLGSVAESVLRELQTPIMVVGPHVPAHAWLGAGRIVACIDGRAETGVLLEPAAELARSLSMPLWLTEVVSPDIGLDEAGNDVIESSSLMAAARRLGDVVEGWDVLHDSDPARALIHHAASGPVSMLVLATHGARGWRRLAEGSTTAAVVHGAEVPVLVVPVAPAPATGPSPSPEAMTTTS
jgi:nucleotide-binding universal stress UspA family protein